MLIDTHCHLDFKDFDGDREDVLSRSRADEVGIIINVGAGLESTLRSIELAEKYDHIYASAGIHPHDADVTNETGLELFRSYLARKKIVAIGEIGLDYYKNISSKQNQKKLFIMLLEEAKKKDLPIIIHNREAHEDVFAVLKDVMGTKVKGVMHCFSGDCKILKECLDLGMFVSFTCNITFKNASVLREVVKEVPMDRFLLETDAPFLAPQILRGKRNEPGYVKYLAEEIARIKCVSFDEIADITTKNAKRLFAL